MNSTIEGMNRLCEMGHRARPLPDTIRTCTMTTNNRLYSVLFNKCPRCGQGDFFVAKSAWTRNFGKMHRHCPHCGEDLVPEPGFYQGALYMSYAFYVLFLLAYFFAYTWILQRPVRLFPDHHRSGLCAGDPAGVPAGPPFVAGTLYPAPTGLRGTMLPAG